MKKTEDKKTVIVVDEQGDKLESTYPKRAKGLIKNGRAQYVDENTICLVDLPKHTILEENKMNNNLEDNKKVEIDLTYIMTKIDEIIAMNKEVFAQNNFEAMSAVPGAKHPIQCLCETNNKMIEFLQDIYRSITPKQSKVPIEVIESLTSTLNNAICDMNSDPDVVNNLINTIANLGR